MMRSFGMLEDGRSIEAITLGSEQGLQVEVLTYGAILRRLTFPVHGVHRDLILNFDRLEHYERDRAYVGCIVGRFWQPHRQRELRSRRQDPPRHGE
jgi:aldose 1-epimerase